MRRPIIITPRMTVAGEAVIREHGDLPANVLAWRVYEAMERVRCAEAFDQSRRYLVNAGSME